MNTRIFFMTVGALSSLLLASCTGDGSEKGDGTVESVFVKTLVTPSNNAIYNLGSASSLSFAWGAATSSSGTRDGVTYTVLLDRTTGDFSSPTADFASGKEGSATTLILSSSQVKELADGCGLAEGDTLTLQWTVAATYKGNTTLSSQTARTLHIVSPAPVAPPTWTWADAADSCTYTLVKSFMNPKTGIWWASRENINGGNFNNYWGQAYPWQTLLYSYERIKDSDPELAATYYEYFKLWVKNNGNNYNGVKKNGFYCQYTDDMAWIALVLLHAYDIWGTADYLTKASEIWDYMSETQRVYEDDEGWGLIWRTGNEDKDELGNQKDTRNVCTNTPAMIICCELYNKTKKAKYYDYAKKLYDFLTKDGRVSAAGCVGKGAPLTYTQGCWIEACRLLYHITGEAVYAQKAATCVSYTMTSGRCTTKYTDPHDGKQYMILRSEGTDGDQRNFKGGLMPYMVNFINDADMDGGVRSSALTFMQKQATVLWFDHMDRSEYPYMFANYYFGKFYDEDKEIGGVQYHNLGWCGMHNCGAALLEGMTRLPESL